MSTCTVFANIHPNKQRLYGKGSKWTTTTNPDTPMHFLISISNPTHCSLEALSRTTARQTAGLHYISVHSKLSVPGNKYSAVPTLYQGLPVRLSCIRNTVLVKGSCSVYSSLTQDTACYMWQNLCIWM